MQSEDHGHGQRDHGGSVLVLDSTESSCRLVHAWLTDANVHHQQVRAAAAEDGAAQRRRTDEAQAEAKRRERERNFSSR